MEGEDPTIAEPTGQETAPAPAEVPTEEPEHIPSPTDLASDEGEGIPEPIEEVEIDWDDGKKYRIPKVLESGILKNKDYTTKTQETAALKKALEADRVAAQERLKATDDELDARATVRTINKDIEAYAKLTQEDWDAHSLQDPLGTEQHWRRYQMLKDQKTEAQSRLDAATKQRTEEAQQSLAKRVQDTQAHVGKLPGANADTVKQLVDFAYERGISEEAIKANWTPIFAELLFDARIGKMAREKQATAQKLPGQTLQPLAKVSGKTTPAANTDLASADMEAYVAARKRGVGGKPLR